MFVEFLQTFYDEKIKFSSKKDKFQTCNSCEELKVFKETKDKLIFSCGGKNDCGTQITINLGEYIHYETQIKELKNQLKSGINWDIIKQRVHWVALQFHTSLNQNLYNF